MANSKRRSARIKSLKGENDEDGQQEVAQEKEDTPEAVENNTKVTNGDDDDEEKTTQKTSKKAKTQKKTKLQKQRKEELKSKTTGVGLKISVDGNDESSAAPVNKKTVFDDSNLPLSDDEETKEQQNLEISAKQDDDDDDDAVEEVQGSAARDKVMDQIQTEEKQSLKTKKRRNRKSRKEKAKTPAKEYGSDDELDDEFFAQLDSVRKKEEKEERKELEKSRAVAKGKHTTFVFEKNKDDDEALSDPVQIDENIQVVVLKNPSSSSAGSTTKSSMISKAALAYSRNRLKDGSDPAAGATEMKRKRNRSGEEVQPWKRVSRPRLAMGRSRMTKGKPAAFFTKKKKNR
uniref:Uncharacterized protein n=1 Tax=Pseudo-nitzschia australis TaxID=44445 RepID=A0A7S4AND7_9STRA|mmetsp:Transcript_26810/g.58809  ORF Transcript_26810/g.58809 Transcript_26810/m.58809 type:complete len:346 (-) Transcript_26810:298-1335(-)